MNFLGHTYNRIKIDNIQYSVYKKGFENVITCSFTDSAYAKAFNSYLHIYLNGIRYNTQNKLFTSQLNEGDYFMKCKTMNIRIGSSYELMSFFTIAGKQMIGEI